MLLTALILWWYGAGWARQGAAVRAQLVSGLDYFSIGDLLGTLFAPFRQISAGTVRGPLGIKLRAWFDRLVSRFVGAAVRLIIIAIGAVYVFLVLIFGAVRIALWPFLPVLPLIAVGLYVGGAS